VEVLLQILEEDAGVGLKIWDFKCQECGTEFEDLVPENTTPLCVSCFSTNVRKILAAPKVTGETPYKTLDKYGIPGKTVVSGKYYRSK